MARIASSDCQALVAMQRPDSRSAIMDSPIQPSISRIVGITSSRSCAMPASIDPGLALIVVERAYTIHPLTHQGSAPVAPPVAPHTAPLIRTWQAPRDAPVIDWPDD